MGKMNMKAWMEEVIRSKQRRAIPIMTHPGIERIGATVRQAVTNGDVHSKAILQLYEAYPAAATTVIMDLTVEAEAFGAEIRFPEDEVPAVIGRLVTDRDSVEALQVPGLDRGRVPEYLKANRRTAARIPDKPVLAGCIGPYSLAGRLYGMTEIMLALYLEPEVIGVLLDKCTDFLKAYCRALKETGVNGVVMAEPAAGLLSDEDCRNFSSVYVQRVVEAVQEESFLVILHNCGNTGHCTPAMVASGAAAYHFGNKIRMIDALDACPPDTLVMGNLDPVGLFKLGTPEEVRSETLALLRATAAYPNFVLSTGCDIPPEVSPAHIEAFYEALEVYNREIIV